MTSSPPFSSIQSSSAQSGPTPRAGILDIEAYVPGKSGNGAGATRIYKLSSNESPLGCSPAAKAAFEKGAAHLERYPDGSSTALRAALARHHKVDAAQIICGGGGSDELLNLLAHAYLGPGDEGLYSAHGFLVYPIAIKASGATPVVAPERDYHADIDAMLARVTPRTRMVFLANPNNPTGTIVTAPEVRRLHAALPKNCILVLDAAYAEYVDREDYDAGIDLVLNNANVVMTRTFSKIYGLAGARIGWALCPPAIADVLNRIRGPFNIGTGAQAAAIAAVEDQDFIHRAVAHNTVWRDWLAQELAGLGLAVTPSVGNFLLVHFAPGTVPAVDDFLISRGIYVRRMEAYGLPDALRMSVGDEEGNHALIAALKEHLSR